MAIDSFVWGALFLAVAFVVATVTGDVQSTSRGASADLEGGPASAALALWLGLSIAYHTFLEWRFGKTLGKYLVDIRVSHDDGSPLTLRSSAVRNLARLVDWLPACYLVGIVAVVLSEEHRRLGDRVGGTVVVR